MCDVERSRNEPIDFNGVDYAIDNRNVEQTILPLARELKIGVVACFPSAVRQEPIALLQAPSSRAWAHAPTL